MKPNLSYVKHLNIYLWFSNSRNSSK